MVTIKITCKEKVKKIRFKCKKLWRKILVTIRITHKDRIEKEEEGPYLINCNTGIDEKKVQYYQKSGFIECAILEYLCT